MSYHYCGSFWNIFEQAKIHGRLPKNFLYERIYKGMNQCGKWSFSNQLDQGQYHGAIFNVEFSACGKTLVAACEKSCLLMFDPATHKKTHHVLDAHKNCVNCIEFLDTRTFITGSDDKTLKQWDLRNLKSSVNTMKGHKGWVKNISYDKSTGFLVSSSFDQTVRVWDVNKFTSDGKIKGSIVLTLDGLLRSKLSRNSDKLFVTLTDGGGILAIHDLDLRKMTNYMPPSVSCNKVDKISDFPHDSDMWCIYSIDVHPYDWCIVSRYVDQKGKGEYLVVHDVQKFHIGDCNDGCEHKELFSMTHWEKESSAASGFIKEVCFSPEGRIISSPYENGIRLLAFENSCNELSDCVPNKPSLLVEVASLLTHKRSVLTSRFSPLSPLIVTGCQGGEVHFHQPKF